MYSQSWNPQASWKPWYSPNIQNSWRRHPYGNIPFQHYPHPMYSQFPQQYPQPNPIPLAIPQIQQPLPLPNSKNPPRPTRLPTKPIANPNNRAGKPAYNAGTQTLPTYVITIVPVQQVQLRLGNVLHQK